MDKIKQFLMDIFNIKNNIINSCIEISCYLCSIIFLSLSFFESLHNYSFFILFFCVLSFYIGFMSSHGRKETEAILKELLTLLLSFIGLAISAGLIFIIVIRKQILWTMICGTVSTILIICSLTYVISRILYVKDYVKNLFHNSKIILPHSTPLKRKTLNTTIKNIMSFLIALTTIVSVIVNIFK